MYYQRCSGNFCYRSTRSSLRLSAPEQGQKGTFPAALSNLTVARDIPYPRVSARFEPRQIRGDLPEAKHSTGASNFRNLRRTRSLYLFLKNRRYQLPKPRKQLLLLDIGVIRWGLYSPLSLAGKRIDDLQPLNPLKVLRVVRRQPQIMTQGRSANERIPKRHAALLAKLNGLSDDRF
jgi:hypothetical protein